MVAARRPGVEYTVAHLPGEGSGELLIVTNDGAEEFRLMAGPVVTAEPETWTEVVPESTNTRLHDVDVFADHVVLVHGVRGRQLLQVLSRRDVASARPVTPGSALVVEAGVPGGLLTLWRNEEPDVDSVIDRGGVVHRAGILAARRPQLGREVNRPSSRAAELRQHQLRHGAAVGHRS